MLDKQNEVPLYFSEDGPGHCKPHCSALARAINTHQKTALCKNWSPFETWWYTFDESFRIGRGSPWPSGVLSLQAPLEIEWNEGRCGSRHYSSMKYSFHAWHSYVLHLWKYSWNNSFLFSSWCCNSWENITSNDTGMWHSSLFCKYLMLLTSHNAHLPWLTNTWSNVFAPPCWLLCLQICHWNYVPILSR